MAHSMMRLHEDTAVFSELIQTTAEAMGLPQVYIEKDYWVTKALKHLSESAHINEVVFKGGTSLSKAYRLIDRFSEDIDLAVFTGNRSDSARKAFLKNIETTVSSGLKMTLEHQKAQSIEKLFINIRAVLMMINSDRLRQNYY
jgi:predicted nucleotidyltransferase component of viral defense system